MGLSTLKKEAKRSLIKVFESTSEALDFYLQKRNGFPKGEFQTEIVPFSSDVINSPALKMRVALREMKTKDWIEHVGSGTLRKNTRLGMRGMLQYREERTAFEFGGAFEIQPSSRVTFNDAMTEGNCHAVTEAGWYADRFLAHNVFPEDIFLCKHIQVDYSDGEIRKGIGLICRQTSAKWVPKGHIVFAIISEWHDETRECDSCNGKGKLSEGYAEAENPC